DATPPVITPQVTGTMGTNGWYTSDVTVAWNVQDPESGIVSLTGCGTKTLTSDTAGVTLTCQVVNGAGLSNTASVTIKIDETAPTIAGMPTACSLWPPNQKMVTVATITASDVLSGLLAGSLQVGGTSNEPTDPLNPDIAITSKSGGFTVQLRADRL